MGDLVTLPHETSARQRKQLRRDNSSYGTTLTLIDKALWPSSSLEASKQPTEVWRSREFLLLVFPEPDGLERLSVCRTALAQDNQRFHDRIAWDDLQRLKRECGRGQKDAVEVYPADADIINVANMRHLWILSTPLLFKWHR